MVSAPAFYAVAQVHRVSVRPFGENGLLEVFPREAWRSSALGLATLGRSLGGRAFLQTWCAMPVAVVMLMAPRVVVMARVPNWSSGPRGLMVKALVPQHVLSQELEPLGSSPGTVLG